MSSYASTKNRRSLKSLLLTGLQIVEKFQSKIATPAAALAAVEMAGGNNAVRRHHDVF